jgi:hypothetical protein
MGRKDRQKTDRANPIERWNAGAWAKGANQICTVSSSIVTLP